MKTAGSVNVIANPRRLLKIGRLYHGFYYRAGDKPAGAVSQMGSDWRDAIDKDSLQLRNNGDGTLAAFGWRDDRGRKVRDMRFEIYVDDMGERE